MTDSNVVAVHGDWLVRADRASVYAIVSDFERMPEHFPKIARSIRLAKRDGDVLTLEAEAGSFASRLPSAKIELTATCFRVKAIAAPPTTSRSIRPETRSCCSSTTRRARVSTDTYFVTVRRRWFKPLFAWMVSAFGLPFWKRSFVDPLESLVERGTSRELAPAG